MSSPTPQLLQRKRYLILGVLLVLASLAWGMLIWQAPQCVSGVQLSSPPLCVTLLI